MDGDDNVVAMPSQCFVDGVIDHLKHQMVQASAVRGVANVHARALAHGFKPFKDLNGAFAVAAVIDAFWHNFLYFWAGVFRGCL